MIQETFLLSITYCIGLYLYAMILVKVTIVVMLLQHSIKHNTVILKRKECFVLFGLLLSISLNSKQIHILSSVLNNIIDKTINKCLTVPLFGCRKGFRSIKQHKTTMAHKRISIINKGIFTNSSDSILMMLQ